MVDPAALKSAISSLQSGAASSVQPLASDLASQFQASFATQKKIADVSAFSADMRAVAADLAPVKRDLDARRARNVALRARLSALQAARSKS